MANVLSEDLPLDVEPLEENLHLRGEAQSEISDLAEISHLAEISRLERALTESQLARATEASTFRREIEKLKNQHQVELRLLSLQSSSMEQQLLQIAGSKSWRLSAPLRWFGRLLHSHPRQLRNWRTSLEILRRHRRSGLFDAEWYLRSNPRDGLLMGDPFVHFAVSGVFENRSPNPYFDEEFYRNAHPEISGSPLLDFVLRGFWENASCCSLFDGSFYASQNPELVDGEVNLLSHYAHRGWKEGKCPHPLFHVDFCNSDSPPQNGELREPLARYLQGGWKRGMRPHPFFDSEAYLRNNPDVRDACREPLEHFYSNGGREGRSPCKFFDCETVFQNVPQLRENGMNPLVYYLYSPWTEDPHPEFATSVCAEARSTDGQDAGNSRARYLPLRSQGGVPRSEYESLADVFAAPILPENPSLAQHPSIEKERRQKLEALFGSGLSEEHYRLLRDHTALLTLFRHRGHELSCESGNLFVREGERSFVLDSREKLLGLSEALWGNAESLPFVFILLQYQRWEHTQKCVDSIRRLSLSGQQIHIVIVDNGSSEEVVAQTRRLFEQDADVSIIFHSENMGFARGNNVGYRYAKERFGNAFLVVMNNDVILEDEEFILKCLQLFKKHHYSVLGPDILTPKGVRENPWNDSVYSLEGWEELQKLFLEQKSEYERSGLGAFLRTGIRTPENETILDPVLQGACYIFSPIFNDCHEFPFDESSFLYGEEFPLAVGCLLSGHLALYSSSLVVYHEEGVSTAGIGQHQKICHGYRGALQGIDISLQRLRRQLSAANGEIMDWQESSIPRLTSDGRKHLLVDLASVQCDAEDRESQAAQILRSVFFRPDTQIWVAMENTQTVDSGFRELCRRFGISVIGLPSRDQIPELLDRGRFIPVSGSEFASVEDFLSSMHLNVLRAYRE